jgi:hypothetical protein
MSNMKKIWGGILLVCLILTLWQIPNFKVLWWKYNTIKFMGQGNDASIYSTSLIDSEATRADPEAGDILNYLVSKPDINEPATLVLKYPDNEFFGYELTNKLRKTDSIYPQAILNAANRLINANPRNAHFHYLKASILLSLHNEDDFDEAIKEIEIGNNAPEFYFAYSKYRDRLGTLFKKGTPGKVALRLLDHQEIESYHSINRNLTHRAEQAVKQSDLIGFQKLTDIGLTIGERIIEHAGNSGELFVGSIFIRSMAGLKLKEIKPPVDVEKVRFQLSRFISILDICMEISNDTWSGILKIITIVVSVLVPLMLSVYIFLFWILVFIVSLIRKQFKTVKVGFLNYFLFAVSIFYYFALLIACAAFLSDSHLGTFFLRSRYTVDGTDDVYLVALVVLITSISLWVIFWIMSLLPPYDKKKLYRFWISKAIVCAALWIAILIVVLVPSVEYEIGNWQAYLYGFIAGFITCVVIWAVSIYGWFLVRLLPYRWLTRNRCVQLILIITFLAALNMLLNEVDWLQILTIFFLIPCSALIVTHKPIGKMTNLVDALFYFFSRNEQMAATRAKILCLLSPYFAFFWFVFLISLFFVVPILSRVDNTIANPLAGYGELPLANKSTYQAVVSKIDLRQIDPSSWKTIRRLNVPRRLLIVSPKDLSRILLQFKESGLPLKDYNLLRIIGKCNSDVYDIIVDSLEQPESEKALISRAKAGDKTIKAKLEQLFDDKLSQLNLKSAVRMEGRTYIKYDQIRALEDCINIASALAVISEPEEAGERYIDIIEKVNNEWGKIEKVSEEWWQNDDLRWLAYNFYISLNFLPKQQATQVLKTYLKKTDYYDLTTISELSTLSEALILFADAELAEQIFKRTCEISLIEKFFDMDIRYYGSRKTIVDEIDRPRFMAIKLRKVISPYFHNILISELKKEIKRDNPNIRAYVVWQLTKLGYEWSGQELKQLFTDDDWKVRLNALFAMDEDTVRTALDDENPVVRVIAKFIIENN